MVSKQVLMKNYQNKRHVIGIISVGRHLSAILNTCKYPAIKYTHFCIKTKMIKIMPFYFFNGHWSKNQIHEWNKQLIFFLYKIYSPCPQDRFTSMNIAYIYSYMYTLECIRNQGVFLIHSITVCSYPRHKLGCELRLPLRGPLALNGGEPRVCRLEFCTVRSLCAFAFSLYGK